MNCCCAYWLHFQRFFLLPCMISFLFSWSKYFVFGFSFEINVLFRSKTEYESNLIYRIRLITTSIHDESYNQLEFWLIDYGVWRIAIAGRENRWSTLFYFLENHSAFPGLARFARRCFSIPCNSGIGQIINQRRSSLDP